jgi:hypothetical protein
VSEANPVLQVEGKVIGIEWSEDDPRGYVRLACSSAVGDDWRIEVRSVISGCQFPFELGERVRITVGKIERAGL